MAADSSIRAACLVVCACLGAVLSGCAARTLTLPSGNGTPLPDVADLYHRASASCASTQTLTAELSLSGRAAGRRVRGRMLVGVAVADRLRLEAVAPFGAPIFILATDARRAMLLFPRENRYVDGATPVEILEALTGLALSPDDLRALLSGCLLPAGDPVTGEAYGDEWRRIDLDRDARLYLRSVPGGWRLTAASRGGLRFDYTSFDAAGRPTGVRIASASRGGQDRLANTDLKVALAQVEVDVPLGSEAFAVNVPDDAVRMTLDELRRTGPLGDQERQER